MVMERFDIWLVNLDPTIGSEIKKTRPAVVISPSELLGLNTVIVAPLTSKGFPYPSRMEITFQGKKGLILLDQIRSVDKVRLIKKIGELEREKAQAVSNLLVEMFRY